MPGQVRLQHQFYKECWHVLNAIVECLLIAAHISVSDRDEEPQALPETAVHFTCSNQGRTALAQNKS